MPFGDGSGPDGLGPRTGRARGFCTGYNAPDYQNSGFGRGFGRGAGRGRGFRRRAFWGFRAQDAHFAGSQGLREPENKGFLEELKAEKAEIEKAIKALEKEE